MYFNQIHSPHKLISDVVVRILSGERLQRKYELI